MIRFKINQRINEYFNLTPQQFAYFPCKSFGISKWTFEFANKNCTIKWIHAPIHLKLTLYIHMFYCTITPHNSIDSWMCNKCATTFTKLKQKQKQIDVSLAVQFCHTAVHKIYVEINQKCTNQSHAMHMMCISRNPFETSNYFINRII